MHHIIEFVSAEEQIKILNNKILEELEYLFEVNNFNYL